MQCSCIFSCCNFHCLERLILSDYLNYDSDTYITVHYTHSTICMFSRRNTSIRNSDKDPVYTVPNPHGHDIKLNTSTTSVALTLTIVLQNLTTSSHRKKW